MICLMHRCDTTKESTKKWKQHLKKFCSLVAQGQAEEFESLVSSESDNEDSDKFDRITAELQALIDEYDSTDNERHKLMILSVVPPEHYSKQKLMKLFSCSRYKVDALRKLRKTCTNAKAYTKGLSYETGHISCKTFCCCFLCANLLQDVAFSTTTLKYDTGEKQTMPRAILTAMKSHVIEEYQKFCSNLQMASPLSDSARWKILRAIKPRQRHAMAGFDNLTADGLKGFLILSDTVRNICDDSKERKLLQQHLENEKWFLKIGYRTHCKDLSPICIASFSRWRL